jgi:hypothetical protein
MVRSAFRLIARLELGLALGIAGCGGSAPSDLFAPSGADGGAAGEDAPSHPEAAAEAALPPPPPPPNDAAMPQDDVSLPPPVEAGGGGDDATDAPITPMPDAQVDEGTPVTVSCGMTTCDAPQFCCITVTNGDQMANCSTSPSDCSTQGGTRLQCTSTAQCTGGDVCCGQKMNSSSYVEVSCQPSCRNGNEYIFCDPTAPDDCPSGTSCRMSSILPDYTVCL